MTPAVPPDDVGRRGRMHLALGVRRGRTVIEHAYCEVPFKITRPHPTRRPDLVHLILMHCTAGVFGGDFLECDIRVGPGAAALLTQQSAAKVHPSQNRPAGQETRILVASGGELHFYTEPLIPFRDARLHTKTAVTLEPGARFVMCDGLMAGRIGSGECWAFAELSAELSVRVNEQLIHLDRFVLAPARQRLDTPWAMRDCSYLGTGLCFGGDPDLDVRLHEALPSAGVDSPAQGLTVVRALAASGPEFQRQRAAFAAVAGSPL